MPGTNPVTPDPSNDVDQNAQTNAAPTMVPPTTTPPVVVNQLATSSSSSPLAQAPPPLTQSASPPEEVSSSNKQEAEHGATRRVRAREPSQEASKESARLLGKKPNYAEPDEDEKGTLSKDITISLAQLG